MPIITTLAKYPLFAPSFAYRETPIGDDHIHTSTKTGSISLSRKTGESGNLPGNKTGNTCRLLYLLGNAGSISGHNSSHRSPSHPSPRNRLLGTGRASWRRATPQARC